MSINNIEKQLDKTLQSNPIKLQGILRKRSESLEEFIDKFFKKFNLLKDTMFIRTRTVHTPRGKRRSLGDIYLILKYYYPDITLLELVKILYIDYKKFQIRSSYCALTAKRMFYFNGDVSMFYNEEYNDEYGHKPEYYISKVKESLNNENI